MDVKSAFLNGIIKELVYAKQPPGFKDPKYTAKTITNPTKTTHALGSAASSAAGVCIDHILVSPDMEILYYTTLIGSFWTSVSDHCPIYIDFKLP